MIFRLILKYYVVFQIESVAFDLERETRIFLCKVKYQSTVENSTALAPPLPPKLLKRRLSFLQTLPSADIHRISFRSYFIWFYFLFLSTYSLMLIDV